MDRMQTKTSTRTDDSFPVAGGFPHLCRGIFLAAGAGLLSAALILVGCAKDSVSGLGEWDGTVPVSFGVEGLSEVLPATRASLATNTTVRVIAYKSGDSNPAQDNYVADQAYSWNGSELVPCTVDDNGSKTADAADQVMKLTPDSYDFYAVSPAFPLAADKTTLATAVANGVDYAAITVRETQQVPRQVMSYALTLSPLQRQCAQISIVIKNDDNYIVPTTLAVNSVSVTGLAASQSSITVGANLTAASSGTEVLNFTSEDFSVSGTTFTQRSPSVALPLSETNLTLTLDMNVDGESQTFTGELQAVTLEQSTKYTITATIITKSDITLSVDSWTEETGNNPEFEDATYPYVVNGNTAVMQDRYGCTVKYPLHGPWTITPIHAESDVSSNDSGINTVSEKFEVASVNARTQSTWANAKTACQNYSQASGAAGTWRLPTIQELKLICILQKKLTACNQLSSSGYYWAATESRKISGNAWVLYSDGAMSSQSKTSSQGIVRCVRDL